MGIGPNLREDDGCDRTLFIYVYCILYQCSTVYPGCMECAVRCEVAMSLGKCRGGGGGGGGGGQNMSREELRMSTSTVVNEWA